MFTIKVESNIQQGGKMSYFWQFLGIIKYVGASYLVHLDEIAMDTKI